MANEAYVKLGGKIEPDEQKINLNDKKPKKKKFGGGC